MRVLTEMEPEELQDAHEAAGVVASEKFRPYLPDRQLLVLVTRFRSDIAEALGLEVPPPPPCAPVRAAKVGELTSTEFETLWRAVDALLGRFMPMTDHPAVNRRLARFREELAAERAERKLIAEELIEKAQAP